MQEHGNNTCWNSLNRWRFTKVLKKLVDYGDVYYYRIRVEVPVVKKRKVDHYERIAFFYKYASSLFEVAWINHRPASADRKTPELVHILIGVRGWRNPEYTLQLLNDLHYDWRRVFFELDIPDLRTYACATARGFGHLEIFYVRTRRELRGLILTESYVTLNQGINYFFGGYLFSYIIWDYDTMRNFFSLERCGGWAEYYCRDYFISKHDAACEAQRVHIYMEAWALTHKWWLYGGWVWKFVTRTGGYKKIFAMQRLLDLIMRSSQKPYSYLVKRDSCEAEVITRDGLKVFTTARFKDLRLRLWFEGVFNLRQDMAAFFGKFDKRIERRKTIKARRRYLFFSNGVYDMQYAYFHIQPIDVVGAGKEQFYIHMETSSAYQGWEWSPDFWKSIMAPILPEGQNFEEYMCSRVNEMRKRYRFATTCVYVTSAVHLNAAFLMLNLLQVLEGGVDRNPNNLKLLDYYALCNRVKIVSRLPNDFRGTFRLGAHMCVYESPAIRQHMYKHLVPYSSEDGAEMFGYNAYLTFQTRLRCIEEKLGEQILNFLAYCSGSEYGRFPRFRSPWDRVIRLKNEQFRPEEGPGSLYSNPLEERPRFFSDKKKDEKR